MSTATERGWGDPGAPGSAEEKAYRSAYIVKTVIAGVTWYVHRKYEPILRELLTRYVVPTIGDITMHADDWSFANRCVRGTGPGTGKPCVKSNHSWGLAVDINATENVMGVSDRDGQFPPDFGSRVAHLMIRWGGDYTSRTDPMHFEFMGTPDDADRIAAIIEGEADMPLSSEDLTAIRKIVDERVDRTDAQVVELYRILEFGKASDVTGTDPARTGIRELETKIDQIIATGAGGGTVDLDALAAKVAEVLGKRLTNG